MERMFEGKTAFVTGGASGIGKAAAEAFAQRGSNVIVATARSVYEGTTLADHLQKQYDIHAACVQCDVTIESQVRKAIDFVISRFDALDFAFNNAGIGPDGVTIPMGPLTKTCQEDWDQIMNVDLKGVFLCMKYELQQMRSRHGGCIINTASTAGLKPLPGFGAYGPAKAGLVMLTKTAALENSDCGIRCNVICPGPTLGTGMSDRSFGKNGEKVIPQPGKPQPIYNRPQDIADVVMLLCSDTMKKTTGNVITVDSGMDII